MLAFLVQKYKYCLRGKAGLDGVLRSEEEDNELLALLVTCNSYNSANTDAKGGADGVFSGEEEENELLALLVQK